MNLGLPFEIRLGLNGALFEYPSLLEGPDVAERPDVSSEPRESATTVLDILKAVQTGHGEFFLFPINSLHLVHNNPEIESTFATVCDPAAKFAELLSDGVEVNYFSVVADKGAEDVHQAETLAKLLRASESVVDVSRLLATAAELIWDAWSESDWMMFEHTLFDFKGLGLANADDVLTSHFSPLSRSEISQVLCEQVLAPRNRYVKHMCEEIYSLPGNGTGTAYESVAYPYTTTSRWIHWAFHHVHRSALTLMAERGLLRERDFLFDTNAEGETCLEIFRDKVVEAERPLQIALEFKRSWQHDQADAEKAVQAARSKRVETLQAAREFFDLFLDLVGLEIAFELLFIPLTSRSKRTFWDIVACTPALSFVLESFRRRLLAALRSVLSEHALHLKRALRIAAGCGNLEFVKFFCDHMPRNFQNAALAEPEDEKLSCIFCVLARCEEPECVRFVFGLIDVEDKTDATSDDSDSVSVASIHSAKLECIHRYGKKINLCRCSSPELLHPIHIAAFRGNLVFLQCLLELAGRVRGSMFFIRETTPMSALINLRARDMNGRNVLHHLFRERSKVKFSPFGQYCQYRNGPEVLKFFFEHFPSSEVEQMFSEVDDVGTPPLFCAAEAGNVEVLTFLSDNCPDFFVAAAKYIVKDTSSAGSSGVNAGTTILHAAASQNEVDVLKFMFENYPLLFADLTLFRPGEDGEFWFGIHPAYDEDYSYDKIEVFFGRHKTEIFSNATRLVRERVGDNESDSESGQGHPSVDPGRRPAIPSPVEPGRSLQGAVPSVPKSAAPEIEIDSGRDQAPDSLRRRCLDAIRDTLLRFRWC